ncbi:MAG: 4Fe-4S binding protein [Candidatus Marinimicrobia bacterium]|nr:4Fe-4S binding protein [Candidatus Neomarinimicrobiota bacterium]
MYAPKLRELVEALRSLFSRPYTTRFPKGKYEPVKEYRGFPQFFEEDCVGCGTCYQVCPAGAIEMNDDIKKGVRVLKIDYSSCIQCGQCEEHCITERGIRITTKYSVPIFSLSEDNYFNVIEKKLVKCEICGKSFACEDHLHFIRKRLGAKSYAHPNLLIGLQKKLGSIPEAKYKGRIRREDYIKEVCPICRHKIVVEDEF